MGPKSFFARPVCEAQVWHWWKYINCAKEPSALPHVIQWLIDGFRAFWRCWETKKSQLGNCEGCQIRIGFFSTLTIRQQNIVSFVPHQTSTPHGGIQKTRTVPSGSCAMRRPSGVPRLPASPSEIWSYHCGAETWNLLDSWPELQNSEAAKAAQKTSKKTRFWTTVTGHMWEFIRAAMWDPTPFVYFVRRWSAEVLKCQRKLKSQQEYDEQRS